VETDLEDHLDSEDAGEDEVERVKDSVALRLFMYGILGSERNAAGADDYHDKQVEVSQIDDEMTEPTQPPKHNNN